MGCPSKFKHLIMKNPHRIDTSPKNASKTSNHHTFSHFGIPCCHFSPRRAQASGTCILSHRHTHIKEDTASLRSTPITEQEGVSIKQSFQVIKSERRYETSLFFSHYFFLLDTKPFEIKGKKKATQLIIH